MLTVWGLPHAVIFFGKEALEVAGLTPKQERFAAEYLVDLNATAAAKRAGYSEKTAYSTGQRLLKNVEIQEAIQTRQGELARKLEVSQERVVGELAAIAFHEASDAPEAEMKVSNKLKALELLGKHLGMFTDKAEASVKVEGSVEVVPLSKRRAILEEIAGEFGKDGR